VLYQRKPPAVTQQVIENPPLGDMNRMLRAVIAQGTGTRAAVAGYDLAGKTGTTSDYKDAWFAGYTGGLTAVVWMGRDDGSPMAGVTGGGAPAEAWRAFMAASLKRAGAQPIPAGPPAPAPPPTAEPSPDLIEELLAAPPPEAQPPFQ
jgi:penicillin-binding protein 1A